MSQSETKPKGPGGRPRKEPGSPTSVRARRKRTTPNLPTPVGGQTKYRPEYAAIARNACANFGATNTEVAELIGVCPRVIYYWKIVHPEFADALRIGKTVADQNVEDRLYNRAVGYSYPTEKIFCHDGEILRADTVAHVPPDVAAAIKWLECRRPEVWRDKKELHLIDDPNKTPEQHTAELVAMLKGYGVADEVINLLAYTPGDDAVDVTPQSDGIANKEDGK